jgi:PIN domain nuclease of toxin-antitoxin system
MSSYVLDASAILALLNNELGAEKVEQVLLNEVCFMSVVNWSEVARKLVLRGHSIESVGDQLTALGLEFKDFNENSAIATATIEGMALSLGDRACLALAIELEAVALTADRIWQTIATGATVECIR